MSSLWARLMLYPLRMSGLLLTSSRAISAAGRQACPPCHPSEPCRKTSLRVIERENKSRELTMKETLFTYLEMDKEALHIVYLSCVP